MSKLLIYCLIIILWSECFSCEIYNKRPKIKSSNGNLILEAAYGKSIYLNTYGPKSTVYLENVDYKKIYNISLKNANLYPDSNTDDDVQMSNPSAGNQRNILKRIENLESLSSSLSINLHWNLSRLYRRVQNLNTKVLNLQNLLNKHEECRSHPCVNGGTCLDLISGYYCLCPSNWKGVNCDEDVNECYNYAGTDLGCQNGATCINKPGSYECICKPGWYGIDCTRTEKNCSQGDFEMCGHGICVPTTSGQGIRCICNQGWTTDGKNIACLTDINECESSQRAHCSVNPRVDCINLPGSFRCGPCPTGYEGDGFACYDIDECLTSNGGCSTNPMVLCHNTIGSRICGTCSPGYEGDGITCTWRGSCSINRGGCHPSAKCVENSLISGITQCVCPFGMVGDGIGIHGCYITAGNSTINCDSNPCGTHGHCHPLREGYTCICNQGYGGAHCDKPKNLCTNNPCHNGGTCRLDERLVNGYRCECTALYSGELCQVQSQPCGGVLDSEEGSIVYPQSNATYNNNARCAWVIHTAPDKVINVTFTKFNLEDHSSCNYDFVQIHDGRSSASQLIGRFCGSNYPNGGNIISSHNNLYFWFRSDHSVAKEGFSIHWSSIAPVCGGEINAREHGHISSPGSPGRYPPNRDCYWHLITNLGKRIQLHFFELDIEVHANCSFDYLAIYDGDHITDPLLYKYCNSTQPAPLLSTGSEILIHFHSDKLGNGKGFQISYAPVEGVPGCGGLFTTDKGEITSPSYNNVYLPNLFCEYQIRTRRDTRIKIEIKYCNLEKSFKCRYDYLQIYDGPSTESPFVSKICDNSGMKTYTSSTNNLFITFRSDHSVSAEGFKITYESICEKIYTEDNGVITSPEYPMNYPKQTTCYYIISTIPGKSIVLTFQDFDVEDNRHYACRYDFVEIKDGPSINSTSIGRFCGGSESSIPVQISTHNFMFIHFRSDISVSGRGFYANYTTVNTECGGIYKNSTGVINHPTDTHALYSNSQSCIWMIIAPEGMHIKLDWSKFILESMPSCQSDYVEILEYDENNFNISLGKYCGTSSPPAITTTSNRIAINFKSDASIRHSGFSVSYSFLDEKTHCGGLFVKSHGFIYSPGWPLSYAANRECVWTITVPIGHQVVLNITDLELERPYNEKCDTSDYLSIWDGATENSSLICKLCGNIKYKKIVTTANSVHLKFYSDAYINGRGFKIEWDGSVTGCGGTLTGVSGEISSPNYPQNYYENAECFYRIVSSSGSRLRIRFLELDLERTQNCNDDYVEIFDGRDSNSESFGKHCFLSPQLNNTETSSNYAFIKFRSDIFISGKGFLLKYQTICNNNISGSFGVIESPGYPNNYPADSNCLWTITVPRGNKINVTFTHFNIVYPVYPHWTPFRSPSIFRPSYVSSCSSSYLQFKETSDKNYLDKKCGSALPPPINTKGNSLQIKFVSGHSFTRTGFRLEWLSYGCGAHIQKQAGIVSMDKNIPLSGELECEWIIETPVGTAVTITFTEVYMTESKNCSIDALELYNGQSKAFPLLSKICTRGLATVQTTSNFLFIRLVKTSPMRDVYFSSHFTSFLGGCGGKISAPYGLIHSKNYPMNYDNNLDCVWIVSVPKNHRIELKFISFDLYYTGGEDDEDDCDDSIKIYDGMKTFKSNYSYLICPKSNVSLPIITNYSNIKLQFTTDVYGSAKGFKLNFTMTCGAVITATTDGIISSAKFINHHKTNCIWIIKAPYLVDKVKFTITHISLPRLSNIVTSRKCPSSYLKVLDGNDESAPLIEEYCGHKSPPTIVSQGNVITVMLGTYTDNLTGEFSAHYSTLTNACGGNLSSEEGSIASPNYPRSYPININCEWTLSTSPGNRVYVTFEKFDLEYSENCNEDYLEIRENNGGGKLLAVYCGHDIPVNITIGSKLYLKFHSDNKDTGQGFLLHYGFLHGNEISGVKRGEIASPLYPRPYEGQGEYTWRIMTSTATTITLNINRLEIVRNGPVCNNKLTVYDGYDVNAPIIHELCGYLTNENKVIQTTSSVVYIILTLDSTNIGALFFISWSESMKNIGNNEFDPEINCGYNDTILVSAKNNSMEFSSPNYPNSYNVNLKCVWMFKTTAGRHLSLNFKDISLEESPGCFADYISIYSLTQFKWTPIKEKICLAETEKETFESISTLKVTFTSDGYGTHEGFSGSVKSVCGGFLNDRSGIIGVTWADFKLKPTFRCNWTIKVRPGHTIQMSFIHFNITNNNDCTTFVMLRNGENIESPLLGNGKFCGYPHENRSFIASSSSTVFVSYVANISLETLMPKFKFQTFRIFYEEKNIDCGVTSSLSDNHKWEVITSPNYPSIPVPYTECIWTFTGPPGEILRIDFLDYFRLESTDQCTHESIEIRDGISEMSPLKRRLCKEKPETIKTSSNTMYIKYSTQIAEPKNGFKANISIDICGGTIVAQSGEISSPGYPHMPVMPWGTVCTWNIISIPKHIIRIHLKDIKLPESEKPCETKLTFEEWSTYNGTYKNNIIQQFCDDDFIDYSKSIETLTNNVTIKLKVGKPSRWTEVSESRGFRFAFNSSRASCSGTLKISEGFLTSPGYPRETILRHCQWTIELPDTTRRVRVELLDYDRRDLIIRAFNDFTYSCPVIPTNQNSSTGINKVFESTGHRLLLYVAIFTRSIVTRFKAKFSSDEPALCGGNLYGVKGELISPDLQINYVCEWRFSETISYKNTKYKYNTIFASIKITSSSSEKCRSSDSRLNVKVVLGIGGAPFLQNICGNNTEAAFPIPASNMLIKATQFQERPLNFNLNWNLNPCGGIIYATPDAMNIIDVPESFNKTINCAWIVIAPVGVRLELKLEGSFNFDCSDEYLKVYRGYYQTSNDIGYYCKSKYQEKPLTLSFKNTLVYYHSKSTNKTKINFVVKTITAQCGGYLMHYDRSFTSPNYPNNYENNKECIWEIQADIGYRISLQFMDRFVIEDTKNCTKDAIIIYDFSDKQYTEINRTCGRVIPPSFNSTSNKMKIVFRTDSAIVLDGFKARWEPICGGTYVAKENEQFLYSPGYFSEYSNSLHCTYEIKSIPNNKVILQFLDFHLEGNYPTCDYDNVTLTLISYYSSNVEKTFCGNEMPSLDQSIVGAIINFNTDRYVNNRGFKLSYALYTCGGIVKEPTTLTSGQSQNYLEDTNCTWIIEAPVDKVIILKFIYIDLESSYECYSDYIAVYDGPVIDDEKRISLMCGHVNNTTFLKGKTNKMVLQFISDSNINYGGFKAETFFTYSESVGCGGTVNLTSNSRKKLKSPLIGNNVVYENYLGCNWVITAPEDHFIKADFISFHIAPCSGVNQTSIGYSKCECDLLELRDGDNLNSLVIATYCGHVLPPQITSSSNVMTIRLSTDGEITSSGFEIELTSQPSACGQSVYKISNKVQTIKSPGYYAGGISRGLYCNYYLDATSEPYTNIHIRIVNLDLEAGNVNTCNKDKLLIYSQPLPRNSSLGKDFILNDGSSDFITRAMFFYDSTIKYPKRLELCGLKKSLDFYVSGSSFISIQTTGETTPIHQGVEVEVEYVGICGRNYTELQARIQSYNVYDTEQDTEDCYTLIKVPETYTISLHFLSINLLYWVEKSYLEIFDGNTSNAHSLIKITNNFNFEDHPVYSTQRYMLLHNHMDSGQAITYDLNYIATNKSIGCGGKLHSDSGRFTSPLYPREYRRVTTCEWEIETPVGTRIMLHFVAFDLGILCEQNYLSIIDRNQNTVSTFCSEYPADYKSIDNYLKVAFTTTMNNGGTGWVIDYITIL